MNDELLIILLIGNGGREHALAWKLEKSSKVQRIYVAPGNGGTCQISTKVENVDIAVDDFKSLVAFASERGVNLVVPGPELPLVNGVEEHFRKRGIYCFGPSRRAARMEGSKAFSKDFMDRYRIPTASFEKFTEYREAYNYLEAMERPVVIKASGLAAGKGVLIPSTKSEGYDGLKAVMVDRVFGDAGDEIIIEEFLEGEEISILSFSDGYTVRSLPAAQDHKRAYDDDKGPNTGGMGCYAPAPVATASLMKQIHDKILQPTIDGMRKDGNPFVGILFTGVMISGGRPFVLEYNVRFGDPETQSVLPLLAPNTDLAEVMMACVERRLDAIDIEITRNSAVTVVVAAGGYPGSYRKGDPIELRSVSDALYFHAGTAMKDGVLSTSGGRVLTVSAVAPTLSLAVDAAYNNIRNVQFRDMFYRRDIAFRALGLATAPAAQLTYESSGVSVSAGNSFVDAIKPLVKSTRRSGAEADIGGFGGTFDLSSYLNSDLVLVGAIDGIGTKLLVAQAFGKHNTIGIDLVAMNVNDLVVQGAEPLAFLDYFACGKLEPAVAADFVRGVAKGCIDAGCALIGGETAEMPGMYEHGHYDGAGAAIGVVRKSMLLPRQDSMEDGDMLLGLASSGPHSNGFSLIRRALENCSLTFKHRTPWKSDEDLIGDAILCPTKIYVRAVLAATQKHLIKGVAHITGGGLSENVPRILPAHLYADIDAATWDVPSIFTWIQSAGNVPVEDLLRTFNMGLGMVCVVAPSKVQQTLAILQSHGEKVCPIGRLRTKDSRNDAGCVVQNTNLWIDSAE